MKKKVLIGIFIISMLVQSLALPVQASAISEIPKETPAPEVSEEPMPEVSEEPMPEVSEEPAPEVSEEPAPEVSEEPMPEVSEEPAPEVSEEPMPEVSEEPIPEVSEEPAPEVSKEPVKEEIIPNEEQAIQLSEAYVYQEGGIGIVTDKQIQTDTVDAVLLQNTVNWDAVYEYIYQQLKAKNTNISLTDFQIPFSSSVGNLVYNVVNEHPDLYYVNVGKTLIWGDNVIVTKIAAVYYDEYDLTAFETAVKDALSYVEESMTDLQKAIILHDYLVINCKYNTSSSRPKKVFNAYGAMVDKTAVCQGYALAYKYLLERAGITSYMVTSESMNHAWNMVKLDGRYYHVDVTFDDPLADRIGYVRHGNMLRSDMKIAENGHEGWVVTYKNEPVNYAATSTAYDNAFWEDVISPLIIKENHLYYINNESRTINKKNMDTDTETVLYNGFETWCSIDGKNRWNIVFSGLFTIGERLYFNSPDYLYSIDLNGENLRVETDKLSTAEGYVYGSACFAGNIYYALHANYTTSGEETLQTATLRNDENIPVSKIVLDQTTISLNKGESAVLTAEVYPSYVSNTAVTWTSSDNKIATVDNGKITAVEAGTCNITASAGAVSTSCQVTVRYQLQPPVFSPGAGTIDSGKSVTITAESGATIFYTTDGSQPATAAGGKTKQYTGPVLVEKDMTISAVAVRKAAVDSAVSKASYRACTNHLIMDRTAVSLTEGEQLRLMVKELPTTKTVSDVTFSSSNASVATVDAQGQILAKFEGTATITASVKDHQGRTVSAECAVTVEAPVYTVTFMGKGSLEPIKTEKVKARQSATPPDMTAEKIPKGYYFSGWDKSYTNIQEDKIIYAQYQVISYTIKYELNGGTNAAGNPGIYTIEEGDIILLNPVKEGKRFAGWYTDAAFTQSPVLMIEGGSIGNRVLYAKWADERELWIRAEGAETENVIPVQQYTGKAIRPKVEVYYGDRLLAENTDYVLSYQNNKKANLQQTERELAAKPAIVIQGKGNYRGTLKKYFVIEPKNLTDSDVQVNHMAAAYKKGTSVKPRPVITWKGKKLVYKTDFILSYPDSQTNKNAYKEPGTYKVIIKAKKGSNYIGEREILLTIAKPGEEYLITKATFSGIPAQSYTGQAAAITENMLQITYGKKPLVYGTDYTIKYDAADDYTTVGTHFVIIEGMGKYKGQKRISFKIKGISVKTMQIKMPTFVYDGTVKIPSANPDSAFTEGADTADKLVILDAAGNKLEEGVHFTLQFGNNQQAGTAKMILTGIGPYTGTLTREFTIRKHSLKEGSEGISIAFANGSSVHSYEKSGAKPKVVVKLHEKILTEGKDYTLSYANHTSANVKSGRMPIVTINGKKNFTGSRTLQFTIQKKDISSVKIEAADKVVSSKAGKFYSTPILTDTNGKKLTAGTDYKTTYLYTDGVGNVLTKKSRPKEGTIIRVTVTGKGNYTGSVSTDYRILKKGRKITDAKVTFNRDFYYTGERIVLSKEDIKVNVGKKTLTADQYEIISSSYKNNLKSGTAKVMIKGKGEYGGAKTIYFTIQRKKMRW